MGIFLDEFLWENTIPPFGKFIRELNSIHFHSTFVSIYDVSTPEKILS